MIHGPKDLFPPPPVARATYDAAIGAKELVCIGAHACIRLCDQGPRVSIAASDAVHWLDSVLEPGEDRTDGG